jgi:hypothetical protein
LRVLSCRRYRCESQVTFSIHMHDIKKQKPGMAWLLSFASFRKRSLP